MLRPYTPTGTKSSDDDDDDEEEEEEEEEEDDVAQRATAVTTYVLRQRWQSLRGKQPTRGSPLIPRGLTACAPAYEHQVAGKCPVLSVVLT